MPSSASTLPPTAPSARTRSSPCSRRCASSSTPPRRCACSRNAVVGFIGPEYLYDGKEIMRAGLEDHFCGKLLGVPMGVDVCYTNHAEADQDDMDALLALLTSAGVNFVMGVPGADDIMLRYQSTSFHDALAMRDLFGRRPAPEFEAWLARQGLVDAAARIRPRAVPARFRALLPACGEHDDSVVPAQAGTHIPEATECGTMGPRFRGDDTPKMTRQQRPPNHIIPQPPAASPASGPTLDEPWADLLRLTAATPCTPSSTRHACAPISPPSACRCLRSR